MSAKGRAGKVAWRAQAATYQPDLADRIVDESRARMAEWARRGRIPLRVRLMTWLTGRRLRLPIEG